MTEKQLDFTATINGRAAYAMADFIIIATLTNYDAKKSFFDVSAVKSVIVSVTEAT